MSVISYLSGAILCLFSAGVLWVALMNDSGSIAFNGLVLMSLGLGLFMAGAINDKLTKILEANR